MHFLGGGLGFRFLFVFSFFLFFLGGGVGGLQGRERLAASITKERSVGDDGGCSAPAWSLGLLHTDFGSDALTAVHQQYYRPM